MLTQKAVCLDYHYIFPFLVGFRRKQDPVSLRVEDCIVCLKYLKCVLGVLLVFLSFIINYVEMVVRRGKCVTVFW